MFVATLYTEDDPSLLSPGAVFLVLVGIFLVQLLSNGRVGGISSLLAKLAEVLDGLVFLDKVSIKAKAFKEKSEEKNIESQPCEWEFKTHKQIIKTLVKVLINWGEPSVSGVRESFRLIRK